MSKVSHLACVVRDICLHVFCGSAKDSKKKEIKKNPEKAKNKYLYLGTFSRGERNITNGNCDKVVVTHTAVSRLSLHLSAEDKDRW